MNENPDFIARISKILIEKIDINNDNLEMQLYFGNFCLKIIKVLIKEGKDFNHLIQSLTKILKNFDKFQDLPNTYDILSFFIDTVKSKILSYDITSFRKTIDPLLSKIMNELENIKTKKFCCISDLFEEKLEKKNELEPCLIV